MTVNGKNFNKIKSIEDIEKAWSLTEIITALKRYESGKEYRAEYNKRPESRERHKKYNQRRNALIKAALKAGITVDDEEVAAELDK